MLGGWVLGGWELHIFCLHTTALELRMALSLSITGESVCCRHTLVCIPTSVLQMADMHVPESALNGHAYHTYQLVSSVCVA